jgi:Flp pilus assembly CpaF family ATPase
MKWLLDHAPHNERLIVIEQPAELKIAHPNAVRWEAMEDSHIPTASIATMWKIICSKPAR